MDLTGFDVQHATGSNLGVRKVDLVTPNAAPTENDQMKVQPLDSLEVLEREPSEEFGPREALDGVVGIGR